MFQTDAERLNFLIETDAELSELVVNEELSAQARYEARPKYITNYIGSKQKLIDWIWKATPESAKSAVDAFSGSSVVGYMYKTKGLPVNAIDRLQYCYHIARAIVENDSVTLSDEEIDGLLVEHSDAKDFVRKHFAGVYFESDVLKLIDIVRSNIDGLSGFKKDIALFALGKTCITANGGFGHFGSTKKYDGADSPSEFKDRFSKNCQRISALVFKGEAACQAHHGDTRKLIVPLKADVAYFDPPYATQFSQTNYERAYHFIEGLMTWWEGKEIQKDSKSRTYEIPTEVTKANAHTFFEEFLGAAKHIQHWIISYRDQAYPTEAEIKKIVASCGKSSRMKTREHQYHISANHGENSKALEHLFVCSPGGGASGELEDGGLVAQGKAGPVPSVIHTRITGQVAFESLEADAAKIGDKKFRFILTHVGTNRNGDNFTPEELKQAAETAVGKKIDLAHSQEFKDIVGGIAESNYVSDGENSRVECVGELYTEESEPARLAYKLMKRGIVSFVSMECDYQEGECSVCGKLIKNKADYCIHLKNYKGRTYQDKPVFETLHGITFTGMGLLDREGADERAEIKQVASHKSEGKGEKNMADDKDKQKKAAPDDTPPDPADLSDAEKNKLIKKQQSEIERLTSQLDDLQKQLDEANAAKKAVVRRARAEKLLATYEEAGREFEGDEGRTAELDRLMKLSDEAFDATEATVSAFAAGKKKPKDENADPNADDQTDETDPKKKKPPFPPKKKSQGNLKADAGVTPADSTDPKPKDLAGKLSEGFMAAYKDRAGIPAAQ